MTRTKNKLVAGLLLLATAVALAGPALTMQGAGPAFGGAPVPSIVSGTDVYSEQMQFFLAGETCLIRQSAITTDLYIVDQVPLNDIAFTNASVVAFFSNGLYPVHYTDVHAQLDEFATFQVPVNGLLVSVSYNHTDQARINARAAKAKTMLQDAFHVELFEITGGNPKTFTFYGVVPEAPRAMQVITSQLPTDGYFGYLDVDRITSSTYGASHHLSGGFASLDPHGGTFADLNVTGGLDAILDQFNFNASMIEDFLGLNFSNMTGAGITSKRTTLSFVQYEGRPGGVTFNPSTSRHAFNMKTALGLAPSATIKPSSNIWNSLLGGDPTGIISTLIDVNVLNGHVIDWSFNVDRLRIDREILDTIYLASGLMGGLGGGDILSLIRSIEFVVNNVFFITHWERSGANAKLYSNVNLTREGISELLGGAGFLSGLLEILFDTIQLQTSPLALLGFRGVPFLLSGLLAPVPNFVMQYTTQEGRAQPNLIVRHVVDEAIKPFQEPVNLRLNVTNVGNQRAWGMKIGKGTASLNDLVGGLFNAGSIDYEVRGFYIPSLVTSSTLAVHYGIENFLLDISSYRYTPAGWWDFTGTIIQGLLNAADTNGDGFMDLHEAGLLGPGDPYNFIDPGQSRIITLPDTALTGLYVSFANETAAFTTATAVSGTPLNGASNATVLNATFWDIASTNVGGGKHEVRVNFSFANETGNVIPDEVMALGFTYQGYNNRSVWANGTATFRIWNHHAATWVNVSTLARSPVSINQTSYFLGSDAFRIYHGDNDSANNTIDLAHYMDPAANMSVLLQLVVSNNASTLVRIDYMGMDYLRRNATSVLVPSKSVTFTDGDGKVLQTARSSGAHVGSQNVSALAVEQYIVSPAQYILAAGQVKNLTVHIENKGVATARNVIISVPIPGIIQATGGFTVDGNYANITIPSLAPGAIATRGFTFTVPNSIRIPGMTVRYDNDTTIFANVSDFTVRANDLRIDAPVSFKAGSIPQVLRVQAGMQLVNPATVPQVGQSFGVNWSVAVSNAPAWFTSVSISTPETPHLDPASTAASVALGGTGTGSVVMSWTKTTGKGYLVPPFMLEAGAMGALTRYVQPGALQVGTVSFTIEKTVIAGGIPAAQQFSIIRDKKLVVVVTVRNTGTLPLGDWELQDPATRHGFMIADNRGFAQAGFTMTTGAIALANITLAPGASTSFNYTLSARRVGTHALGNVVKEHYFVRRVVVESNAFEAIIEEKPELIAAYLGTGIGVLVVALVGSSWTRKKQQRAWEEFTRKDTMLLQAIQEPGRTYEEYLDD